MESAISLGVLTGVSWGASTYHEKRIAANNKMERREQRRHKAEIQRHKLRADFEREKREIAERAYSKTSKRLEVARLEYYDSFSQQSACANLGGHITCLQPVALTLDPASNGSSNALNASEGILGLPPIIYIIAGFLMALLMAHLLYSSNQQHVGECKAKDQKAKSLETDLAKVHRLLDDTKKKLNDSQQMQKTSEARAEQLENNLAETRTSLEDTKGQFCYSEQKLKESVENVDQLENSLAEVNESLDAVKEELRTSQKKQKDSTSHAECLEKDLAKGRNSLEVTKGQLVDSEKKLKGETSRAKQLEIDLANAKNSLQSKNTLLQQAESTLDMHRTNTEVRQKQVEESRAEISELHVQLTSLQQERNGYKLANEQSTNDKGQLVTSLAEVKDSLNHTNQELGNITTELCNAKRKHNDHKMLVRRVLAKCGEHVRDAREAHLIVKYGLLWRLRVRAKTSMSVAASAANVLDDEHESEGGDDEDEEGAEDSSTPDVNAGEERNAEEEKSREQEMPDEGNTTNEKETIEEEQKTDQEGAVEHKETSDHENSTGGASSISQDRKSNGDKGGKDGRRQRGMKPNQRKRLIEEGVIPPWRDPAWIDPSTGLPSNGKPPKHLREKWAAEKPQKKNEGEATKAKPPETKQDMLPAVAPQTLLEIPKAPRAMVANGLRGLQPPTEPKAMRNDTHEQTSNLKGGFSPPHLRHKQMVNKPVPVVQPDSFDWANHSLAQSARQEAELQNQAALTAMGADFPHPDLKPKYNFLPPHLRHPRIQPDPFDWANQSLAQSTQQEAQNQAVPQAPSFTQPQQNGIYASAHANTKMPSLPD